MAESEHLNLKGGPSAEAIRATVRTAINVEAGVKKRMRLNSQCINQPNPSFREPQSISFQSF
jgi:hypothetical protein